MRDNKCHFSIIASAELTGPPAGPISFSAYPFCRCRFSNCGVPPNLSCNPVHPNISITNRALALGHVQECNILELRGESTSESGSGRSSESSRSDHAPLATALSKREECCACQPGETCLHDGSVPMYLRRAFMYTGYPTGAH